MERRKFVIGLGSLAAGGAAATGTGAFTAAQISDRDANITVSGDDEALIQLIPGSDDPGNPDNTVRDNRVGYTSDDELYISFDDSDSGRSTNSTAAGNGINPDSYYQVGSVDSDELDELRAGIDDTQFGGPNPLDSTLASDTSLTTDPAFIIRNASDNTRVIELSYDAQETPNGNEATGILGLLAPDATGDLSSGGAAVLALDVASNQEVSDSTTADLAPGEQAYVGLFIEVDDVDPNNGDNFEGSLRINAGQAARNEDTINTTNT